MVTEKNISKEVNRSDERVLSPAADIYETRDEYRLKLEMPGVEKDGVTVTLDKNELTIEGKIQDAVPDNRELQYAEYPLFNYYRKFRVGEDINREKIEASLDSGILTVILHKAEEAKPRKIEVKVV